MATTFSQKVISVITKIPKGRVATYQQIAALSGQSHAARAVAWLLNSSSKKYNLPWQRVVSKQGKIAFKPGTFHFKMQRSMLTKEGVLVDLRTGKINMTKYQYRKKPQPLRRTKGSPQMFSERD